MRTVRICGLTFAVCLLDAPDAVAQHGAHPVHETNIELCRAVWHGQPEQEERCLIARRDLVQTLERNPYAHAEEKVRAACRVRVEAYAARRKDVERSKLQKAEFGCAEPFLQQATWLSFWFNYFHSAVADAVMWNDQHQESDAAEHLERLLWCGSKYGTDAGSMNYSDVLRCAYLWFPGHRNPEGYKFGPRK